MLKEKTHKKLVANWLRKGSIALIALATVVLCMFVFYSIMSRGSSDEIGGAPNMVMYLFIGVVALGGVLVLCLQIISIFTNKMILSPSGIEIKRIFKQLNIPKDDIIRIDGIHERVVGEPTQSRSVFKIVTHKKTYEVNSHEFLGLKKAIQQWAQKNMVKEESESNEA